jgi:amino acid adenylation domain-containing protein
MSLIEGLIGSIHRHPDLVAVVDDGLSYTFDQLDRLSAAMAGGLTSVGVRQGDLVAVHSTRSWQRCAVVLAAWRVGAGVVSVDPGLPAERTRRIVTGSGARLVVRAGNVEPVGLSQFSADELIREPIEDVTDGPLAYVIPTSGSTGEPKAVAVPPVVLEDLGNWHIEHWRHDVPPHTLHAASIGFDVVYEDMVATWLAGATLVVVDDAMRRDYFGLFPILREHDIARFFLPVASLHGLAMVGVYKEEKVPSLRELAVAGEQLVINDEVRAFCRANGIGLINQYGPSETHVVTQLRLGPDPDAWPDRPAIGGPVVDAEMHRDDSGVLRPFEADEEGELVISGRCVGLGYIGDEALTASRFREVPHRDGGVRRCYYSGDLVRFDGANYHFLARTDDQIKINGYRVEPGEVEAVLGAVPGVRRAVAFGVRKHDVPQLAVCYTLERRATVQVEDLREACRRVLPDYLVPTYYRQAAELPFTPNGKVDRKALAAAYASSS